MKIRVGLTAATALLTAHTAHAGSGGYVSYATDNNNLDLTPWDDTYDGSLGTMASLSLDFDYRMVIADINITLDLSHTWAGDLTIKVMSPNGTVIDLVSRPGYSEAGDDGSGCCGSSADIELGTEYVLDDAGADSSENMGNHLPGPFTLYSSGFGNTHGLSMLNGEFSKGTWTIFIGDSAGGDNGIFDGFTVSILTLPVPSTLALLSVAGLAARRRRRA